MGINRRDFLKQGSAFAGLMSTNWAWAKPAVQANLLPEVKVSGPEHDFRKAVVYAPGSLTRRERKAVQVLVEEVQKRTQIRWPVVDKWPEGAATVIAMIAAGKSTQAPEAFRAGGPMPGAEGYRLKSHSSATQTGVSVTAVDERGLLFGAGGLLRQLTMMRDHVSVPENLDITTQPHYKLRGHQLGYRNLNNTCDGWSPDIFEQYIRDMAVFGTNAVEFIPPYPASNEWDSPNFTLTPHEMLVATSKLCDDYGLDVWLWYPSLARNYGDAATVAADVDTWGKVFASMPRIDAVFVPGGDPGHTPPELLMPLLEKQTENLHRWHPHAQMWVSPQGFDKDWMQTFLGWLRDKRPEWLTGVVYGPGIHIDIHELRKLVPERYDLRFYPDITHSLSCQYPVPDWDIAFAFTEGREVINPRLQGYARIFGQQMPETIGFLSYSEGVNDDANKMLYSALGWNPATPVAEFARDYSRYFVGPQLAEGFAQGLLQLERHWDGPLAANPMVEVTLQQFQALEEQATPQDLVNWRFQMGLYRAYLDAYVRRRLLRETALEEQARTRLQQALRAGGHPSVNEVIKDAEALLMGESLPPAAPDWRSRLFELGGMLYDSIRIQLSTERYHAKTSERGATLDTMDAPLSNAPWLLQQLETIRALPSERQQIDALRELLNRTNPGPGGFYDNLGDITQQPHLVRGEGGERDPEFRHSALAAFAFPDRHPEAVPMEWKCCAASLYDAALQMHYTELEPGASYRLRVVYAGNPGFRIALSAGDISIHPFIAKPRPQRPMEFDIPADAIRDGELTLTWRPEDGPGGSSRGCQVAEVWLLRTQLAKENGNLGVSKA